jgi:hypothetical protein
MRTALGLFDLLTAALFGWLLWGVWVGVHLAPGGHLHPFFWIALPGVLALLGASVAAFFRPRAGGAAGLVGCVLVWPLWGLGVAREGLSGEGVLYTAALSGASILSCVALAWRDTPARRRGGQS